MKIVTGSDDPAGMNMAYFIRNDFGMDVVEVEGHPVFAEHIEKTIRADENELIVVLSKHSSEKKVRSLTVHPVGNFDTNDLGGEKFRMSYYNARFARSILMNVHKYAQGMDYEVTYEATHHGPYSDNPIIFVEIGSTDVEYNDRDAGLVMARSVNEAYEDDVEVLCGIGGLHYATKFTSLAMRENIAMGHIASKYRINALSMEMLEEMKKKSIGCNGFVIEEKSFNSLYRKNLKENLDSLSYSYKFI
jgi:D-aminoacyl-tRNA deacylase